jgi:hypothetical protein
VKREGRDLPQGGPLKLPDYYLYAGVPVRFLETPGGGTAVERLDAATGDFVADLSLMQEILFNPGTSTPIERVSEAAFGELVRELREKRSRP